MLQNDLRKIIETMQAKMNEAQKVLDNFKVTGVSMYQNVGYNFELADVELFINLDGYGSVDDITISQYRNLKRILSGYNYGVILRVKSDSKDYDYIVPNILNVIKPTTWYSGENIISISGAITKDGESAYYIETLSSDVHVSKTVKDFVGGEIQKEKCFRVFASSRSTDGGIFKVKNEIKNPEKFAITPDKCFINNGDVNGVSVPAYLDRDWYIDFAKKRLKDFGRVL